MGELGIAVQEQFTAWWPILATIVLSLPGAALGGLTSLIITDRLKARYQEDLERVKLDHQRTLEILKGENQRENERLKSDLARDLAREAETLKAQLSRLSF